MAGYPQLASLIGAYPEVATLRRFGALNARNLPHPQAEPTVLEDKLRQCEKADRESRNEDRAIDGCDWQTLAESGDGPTEGDQWAMFLKIREKLNEYSEYRCSGDAKLVCKGGPDWSKDSALLVQQRLARFDLPNARDLGFLVNWMKSNVYLLGQDSDIWEKPEVEDMVALKTRPVGDLVSRFLTDSIIHWYHRIIGRKIKKQGSVRDHRIV
ncbi:hypothetical protein BU26DRAFT_608451 [Trematosphaeria pertusa]|uniref:DUF6594 domain-containing protein n=1 Tax=Trematosphaeria pertusa TaxID=390896 RepID=A0A6A6I4U1_9PLEO|nr:uncharacterized protein BU26DRAFT_608451 [Trematosphaeria pertusa]KAF2244972.1 hypothetical protein BU26DRAFT_608451 [Trematosphaeria pertusa]